MTNLILINIILFIIGAAFGSFISVVFFRTMENSKGIFIGRSRCPHCQKNLKFYHLIPIVSWSIQRGRCSFCKKQVSYLYPLLEVLAGMIFILNYNYILYFPDFIFYNQAGIDVYFIIKLLLLDFLGLNLLLIFFSDLNSKEIPSIFLYLFILITFPTFYLASTTASTHLVSIIIVLLVFGSQYFLSAGKWLGSGDLYLSFGMALLLSWPQLLIAIFFAYLVGGIYATAILLSKSQRNKDKTVAFTPFLIFGTLIALYGGSFLIDYYLYSFLYAI